MKTLFQTILRFAPVLLLLLAGGAMTARAQGPKLQMDQPPVKRSTLSWTSA